MGLIRDDWVAQWVIDIESRGDKYMHGTKVPSRLLGKGWIAGTEAEKGLIVNFNAEIPHQHMISCSRWQDCCVCDIYLFAEIELLRERKCYPRGVRLEY